MLIPPCIVTLMWRYYYPDHRTAGVMQWWNCSYPKADRAAGATWAETAPALTPRRLAGQHPPRYARTPSDSHHPGGA